ncbi:acyl-CoA dehydrogenase family protein [Halpernia frigidisoli]|uniref:Acyl-CoA dehydrogenase n=1 Tax=Halpernia frigidisoli TaxID=1125876 RepID=A0A1I3D0Y3_9FLAO|nr:acyl-CoA dehydrogenase family protein [Halpernia frigidisoli]SFH80430.1 Acyl-CoA dehydrogenase [Halpernia frigidisoli]
MHIEFSKLNDKKLAELIISSKKISKYALVEASKTDSVESFPKDTLAKIINAGLLKACIPAKFGGSDLGLLPGTNETLLMILKYIGSGNLVMGRVLEGHINAQLLINQFGKKSQIRNFSEDAIKGKLFAVWNTQAHDGTFLTPVKNNNFHLNGSKTFATGIDYVTRPLITAGLKNESWQMCIVNLDKIKAKTDSSWWNPMGMKASRSFKISFKNANVDRNNLIGKPDSYYLQPSFSGGSVRFAAVQLGAAERLLEETKKYLLSLGRTEDPFQKMRVGEMAIAVVSGNQWLKVAAEHMDVFMNDPSKINSQLLLASANMTRTAIEKICTEVMMLCQKCVGARGLNNPYHFERIIRDLNTYLRQPAPDASLADVGKYILNKENKTEDLWDLTDKNKF